MALTRARPVYGSPEARAATQAIIDEVLTAPRDAAKLIADAGKMRGDMAAHKPPKGPLDVKLAAGGLVDLEFVTHVTQLRTGQGLKPQLADAIRALVALGHLEPFMTDAHALMTRMLVTVRLMAPSLDIPPEITRPVIARASGMSNWEALLAELDATRHRVAKSWMAIVAPKGD